MKPSLVPGSVFSASRRSIFSRIIVLFLRLLSGVSTGKPPHADLLNSDPAVSPHLHWAAGGEVE